MKSYLSKKTKRENKSISNEASNNFSQNENSFQDNSTEAIQMRQLQSGIDNSEETTQLKAYQKAANDHELSQLKAQPKKNDTGIPDDMKSKMESFSGYSLDDVNVHYNSEKPAQLRAHAFAQGTDVHIASGQEKHLGHELGHVIQQKQGKVKATKEENGQKINDDTSLEKGADQIAQKAAQTTSINNSSKDSAINRPVTQQKVIQKEEETTEAENTGELAGTLQQLGTSYVEWVMENCIIPEDKTFLYVKRIGMDPFECLDLYSKANPPTDLLQVVAGQVAENTQWIKTATKVMSALCIVVGAVNFGTAALAGAGAVDLLLGSKFIFDAANFVTFNFVVNSEYDQFEEWLRFHLSYKSSIMREWAAAEGIELNNSLINALQKGFKN